MNFPLIILTYCFVMGSDAHHKCNKDSAQTHSPAYPSYFEKVWVYGMFTV